MRLSHRDFRPKKRRKYVVAGSVENRSAPSRIRLAIRILLLAGFGILVYLKYDSFIQSPLIQGLRQPDQLWKAALAKVRKPAPPVPPSALPRMSADSSVLQWSCASAKSDSCLDAWKGPDAGEKGSIRALLWKARLHLDLPHPSSFSADFRRVLPPGSAADSILEGLGDAGENPDKPWRLERIRIQTDSGRVDLVSGMDAKGGETWCLAPARPAEGRNSISGKGEPPASPACLDEPDPKPPLRLFSAPELRPERPPVLTFPTGAGEAVYPVLPGKVMELPAGEGGWLKVYHGRNLFSYYSGFAGISKDLRAGARVGFDDTLGFAGSADSAAAAGIDSRSGALSLRMEQDGAPLDPLVFLGLPSEAGHASAEAPDAR